MKEYTEEEVRVQFLEHMRMLVQYWATIEKSTIKESLEGLMHSVLVTLDGGSADLPGFQVIPIGTDDDTEWHKAQGEKWYPEVENVECDIAGFLHEEFHKK